jgi:S1-C subfamily serine protease
MWRAERLFTLQCMTTDTLALSQQLASTVERFQAPVVRIEARRHRPASGVIWSADGLVVTTHHAVEVEEGIRVGLEGGQEVAAKLVGRDPSTDVALLQLEGHPPLTPVQVESAADLKVGHLVMALARPGRTLRATWGIVSALGEGAWRTPLGGELERYLQTDLALGPGFSGGPLVDATGRFLGITTPRFSRVGTVAVTAPTLTRVVEAIRAHGSVRRGYLGVGAYPVRLPQKLQDANRRQGLILLSVEPGGPADQAGLLLGDTLLELDGKPVAELDDLLDVLAHTGGGREVALKLLRSGALQDTKVTVGER